MSVLTRGAAASVPGACARGVSVGTGGLAKISGWRSISMTSACLGNGPEPREVGQRHPQDRPLLPDAPGRGMPAPGVGVRDGIGEYRAEVLRGRSGHVPIIAGLAD